MVDSIGKFDEDFKEAVIQANSALVAKQCVERFLALRGDEKEFEVTTSSKLTEFTGLQDPKTFYHQSSNTHLRKVGLQMIKPDNEAYRFIVSRIKPEK